MEENNENNKPVVPPAVSESTDGSRDAELLRAICDNPETAQALADIASGRPAEEVLRSFLPETEEAQKPEPEVAMYQSPALAGRKADDAADSFPSFLSGRRQDFWEEMWDCR